MAVPFKSALISAFALASTLGLGTSARADPLTENFDAGVPQGWVVKNLSEPLGTIGWFQGNEAVFEAHQGAPNSYVAANFASGANISTISNWLILPTSTYRNGDTLSFYTRSADLYPDRMEVRFSDVGGTDVGSTATSVGTFSTLLISINPMLQMDVYPEQWTRYSTTLSGLTGPTSGAFAFRYTVTDGGLFGQNSNYIGIDTVQIAPIPEPGTYVMMAAGLAMVGWMRRRQLRA